MEGRPNLQTELYRVGGAETLRVRGEVDCATFGEFEAAVASIGAGTCEELVVDLTDCSFVSLAGYRAIGELSRRVPLTVLTSLNVAQRVLDLLGFGVTCKRFLRAEETTGSRRGFHSITTGVVRPGN